VNFFLFQRRVTSPDRAKCMLRGLHHTPDSMTLCLINAWFL